MDLPLVIEAQDDENLLHRTARDRAGIRRALRTNGAVLLRGFAVEGVDGFEAAVRELSGGAPLPYEERSSPRSTIKGRVYTSTDYPPHEEIFFHNENSYRVSWPMSLYFYCVEPPRRRGATPLSDTREVLRALDPAVREEFERRGWKVVRNFGSEFGLSWQEVFNSGDRAQVERFCAANDVSVEWRPDGGLRTSSVRDAVHRHPETGEEVWFNHAAIFHLSTLSPEIREGMLELFDEEDLPNNSYFGDGAAIPDDVMAHVRDCYRSAATRFDYVRDDVLVVDNMLTAHGREPFTRPRTIAVAMAEPGPGVRA
ncbi:Taurine dioxygenase, alpha-ketoglutarate-dependent [Streptomyces sp. MnatMP-M77]|uniref:TauD/TfdA family dioxygenase n=1 Tax=unclassified Streptomyces TaxID=2593676 RepID=UPI000805D542|nr:TauD/TfdA family dioxygenase [Streptomyces sp. MnatMP-M77]MYT78937.1 TauD/TfdA family dioxygenase [Streptomyces sp. SID8364]SBU93991.1 Taurine dioxygenase, alpha-ketoglutarate-dependent [Streptomyces sp. MnatMP-M77]